MKNKIKQLQIILLKEKIERLTGKKIIFEAHQYAKKKGYSEAEELEEDTKDNSVRPSKMARPDITGMTKNAKAYWPHLYIQDEAEDILQDKFGNERGSKAFQGLLNAPKLGGFYQATTEIVMQKARMYQDLGERLPNDYFDESWFSVWKRWMASKGKPYEPKTILTPKVPSSGKHDLTGKVVDNFPTHSSINKPAANIAPTSIKRSSNYDSKDEMRISDIMSKANGNKFKARQLAQMMADKITSPEKALRRANAAEDNNYHDLANIFLKRYAQLK